MERRTNEINFDNLRFYYKSYLNMKKVGILFFLLAMLVTAAP